MSEFTRSFPLADIAIRSGGDGRTVEAYAAVFNTETDIADAQGRYREQIHPTAFEYTVQKRGKNFGVFYNHALTLQGTPSEMASVPLGSPVEAPRSDGRGLVTVTRYNATPLADQVLEAIRNGDIKGQSFSGKWIRSTPSLGRSMRKYQPAADGTLPLVTRMEVAMTEYGPTPIPAYENPMVLSVRHRSDTTRLQQLDRVRVRFARATMTPDETQNLTMLLAMLAGADAGIDPIVEALCAADCALDAAQMVVSSMLAVPDPDVEDDPTDPADMAEGDGTPAAASGSLRRTAPAARPLAAEDSRSAHSGRLSVAQRVRAGMVTRGISR
jgi:HK97 family phage prohead protease